MPRNAAKILNTIATMPRAVNPSGSLSGGFGTPVKSRKSLSLPAALPTMGIFCALQASKWFCGMEREFWSEVGASIIVAMRPDATCHSMWQWKSQTRGEERSQLGLLGRGRYGWRDLSGLSALKRRTMLPIGRTMKVSRLIGTAGKVSFPTYSPASSSDRTTAWKLWPWRWKGCRPESLLFSTISMI